MIAVLLAGRRALMLILLMVPFLAIFFRRVSGVSSIEGGRGVGKIIFVFTFFAVCVGGVILLAGLNVNQAAERIESAFAGDSVRVDQFISSGKGLPILLFLGLASVDLSMLYEAKNGRGCMNFPICNCFSMVACWGFL